MAKKRLIVLSCIIIAATIVSIAPFIDQLSYTYHEESFKRALYAFGIAKTLNGVISLFQGTEIQGSLIVAGATFSIGEILDPLNDMVERFSWLMLASSVALGIEKLLISLGAAQALKIIIFLSGICALIALWVPNKLFVLKESILRFFIVVMILRFCMPALELSNSLIHSHFTQQTYAQSMQTLSKEATELESSKRELPKELSFYQKLNQKIDSLSEEMVNIMVVFTFHTILLPLLFLWITFNLIKAVILKREKFSMLYM